MLTYFVILYILGFASSLYLAGQGGYWTSAGTCLFSAAFAALNFILLLNFGFPEVF